MYPKLYISDIQAIPLNRSTIAITRIQAKMPTNSTIAAGHQINNNTPRYYKHEY